MKKAAGKDKFTPIAGHFGTVVIPIQYVYEIAKIKKELDPDLKNLDVATIMTVFLPNSDDPRPNAHPGSGHH